MTVLTVLAVSAGKKSVMITRINYLRIFSVMITDWETNLLSGGCPGTLPTFS